MTHVLLWQHGSKLPEEGGGRVQQLCPPFNAGAKLALDPVSSAAGLSIGALYLVWLTGSSRQAAVGSSYEKG